MADIADNTDPYINNVIVAGIQRSTEALTRNKLTPIVFVEDGNRYGVCHWCESTIQQGHLFCIKDPRDSGRSCSEEHDHEQRRMKELGL
jgi:hypothetical protein